MPYREHTLIYVGIVRRRRPRVLSFVDYTMDDDDEAGWRRELSVNATLGFRIAL